MALDGGSLYAGRFKEKGIQAFMLPVDANLAAWYSVNGAVI